MRREIVDDLFVGLAVLWTLIIGFMLVGCAGAVSGLDGAMVAVDVAADKLAEEWEQVVEREVVYCRQMPDYGACMAEVLEVGAKIEQALAGAVVGQEAALLLLDAVKEIRELECGRHPEECNG